VPSRLRRKAIEVVSDYDHRTMSAKPSTPLLRRLLGLGLIGSFGVIGLLGLLCACRAEPTAQARLQGEIDRLDKVLQKLDADSPGGTGKGAGLRKQLAAIRSTSSPSLLAYQLRGPFLDAETMAFIREHPKERENLALLEALWVGGGRRERFAVAERPVPRTPLLAALAQGAANHAEKLYRAAMVQGRISSLPEGVLYLGQAEAHMRYYDLLASLSLPPAASAEPAPDAAALQAAHDHLEEEMLDRFVADPSVQSLNGVSARLKEAQELLDRGSREGAVLPLLECRMELSRQRGAGLAHNGSVPDAASGAAAEKSAEGSILSPYLHVVTAGPDSQAARIVRADIIPFYRSLFRS
jgi:hypothetical protein